MKSNEDKSQKGRAERDRIAKRAKMDMLERDDGHAKKEAPTGKPDKMTSIREMFANENAGASAPDEHSSQTKRPIDDGRQIVRHSTNGHVDSMVDANDARMLCIGAFFIGVVLGIASSQK